MISFCRRFVGLLAWVFYAGLADPAPAQTAAFAYQGRLTEAGNPATGTYEMTFKLFDTPTVGTGVQQGTAITNPGVAASAGVFTVTLDFGVTVFDGSARFLEISVKRAGTASPPSLLSPRQAITPVPYAIHTLSASQLDGLPATSFVKADASGNVGIGTSTPAPGVLLEVDGPTRLAPGGSGGYLQVGTPGGETGLSVIGDNRLDLRFNGQTAVLSAAGNTGPTPYQNGIVLNTNGNVGIGMGAPFLPSAWKLEVNGPTRVTPVGDAGGAIQFSTPNGETGMSILGQNRADLRFDDFALKLVAGPGAGTPGNASGVSVTTAGNVGIGTVTPANKLSVAGNADISGNVGIGTASPQAKLHVNGGLLVNNGRIGVGTIAPVAQLHAETPEILTAAVYGNATGPGGVGVYAQSGPEGRALHADGNATQAADKAGMVKAMLYVGPDGTIIRCYNGITGASTPADCNFKVTRPFGPNISIYQIDFGFPVRDRFISVTPGYSGSVNAYVALDYRPLHDPPSHIRVSTLVSDTEGGPADFTVIVF